MTLHTYSEDQLIEQPAVALFAELRWKTVSAREEIFGADGTLERETSAEVVLLTRLRAALTRLIRNCPTEQLLPPSITSHATVAQCFPRRRTAKFTHC